MKSLLSGRPSAEAQRRQLTVRFCDMADATRLSRQRDPKELCWYIDPGGSLYAAEEHADEEAQ